MSESARRLFARVEARFHQLAELPDEERAARLDALRTVAPELHDELVALFGEGQSTAQGILEREDALDRLAVGSPRPDEPTVGSRIGPYRLLRLIGTGGMGRVFEAEQLEPLERRVAVKVLRDGVESKPVLARFEAERRALAVMSHPHIAHMLDAGATDDGHPWFAMELVDGLPITHWAEEHALDLEARIALLLPVCDAVQHAHVKGVIHRDLKPSNILVSPDDAGRPVPKVIDFGIAKAVEPPLLARTKATRFGELVGTPEYMSPEQATLGAVDVDTRSDVYGLGLVLYELLVGELPLPAERLRGLAFDEICRRIREDETPRPSSRLATSRPSAPGRPTPGRLRGELDTVLLKALAKDRDRRYESAAAFAGDLRRYLRHEAVEAVPPSHIYRLGKIVRRHRAAVALGALAAIALVVGLAAATLGLLEARRSAAEALAARAQAEAAQARAEASQTRALDSLRTSEEATDFLVRLFQASDPRRQRGLELTVGDLLDRGAERIGELDDAPTVQARLLEVLGDVSWALGAFDRAEPLLDRALELRRTSAPDTERQAAVLNRLGALYRDRSELVRAEAAHRRAVELLDEAGLAETEEMGSALNSLGIALSRRGRNAEAADVMERSLGLTERLSGEASESLAGGLLNLASLRFRAGEIAEAEKLAERSLELFQARLPEGHPNFAAVYGNLSQIYRVRGRLGEALASARKALAVDRAALPAAHPLLADDLVAVLAVEDRLGRLDRIRATDREVLEILAQALGPESLRYRIHQTNARALTALLEGDPATALVHFDAYREILRTQAGDRQPRQALATLRDRIVALLRLDRPREAVEAVKECRALAEELGERPDLPILDLFEALARLDLGDEAGAVEAFERATTTAGCGRNTPCVLDHGYQHLFRTHWHLRRGEIDLAFETLALAVDHTGWTAWMLDTPELADLPRDDRRRALESRLAAKVERALALAESETD